MSETISIPQEVNQTPVLTAPTEETLALSQEFYGNPDNYGTFSVTRDGRHIVGCIDPRDPTDEEFGGHKIMKQTPGAGVGEAADLAVAYTEVYGDVFRIEDAAEWDSHTRVSSVLGAHYGCKYVLGMSAVLREMADPSDFTRESATKWAVELGTYDNFAAHHSLVKSPAMKLADYIDERGAEEGSNDYCVNYVGALYPGHSNVKYMKGANVARVYTTNMHPHLGIDRNKKPKCQDPAQFVQGYHDNVGATFLSLNTVRGMSPEVRNLRVASLLLRSAATRTILTDGHMDEMTFFKVDATPKGVRIQEQTI
jgi:hypothetical protein